MKIGWGQRLKEARGPLTQRQWAVELGIGLSVLVDYETEKRPPRFDVVAEMARRSGLSLDWLATGEGPKGGGVNLSVLQTAVTSALQIVESARKDGKSYTSTQITSFIVDIYGTMIKEIIDGINSLDNKGPSTLDGAPDEPKPQRNRKESA
jgi:transcriptional regulator with XRE-family HTH domain